MAVGLASSDRIQPSASSCTLGNPPSHVLGHRGLLSWPSVPPPHISLPGLGRLMLTDSSFPTLAALGLSLRSILPGPGAKISAVTSLDIGTDASLAATPMMGSQTPSACLVPGRCWACDYRGKAHTKPHLVPSEDWVLGSVYRPGLARPVIFGPLRIREAPGLSGREHMWSLEKRFILHVCCPGPKTWVRLPASFTLSTL